MWPGTPKQPRAHVLARPSVIQADLVSEIGELSTHKIPLLGLASYDGVGHNHTKQPEKVEESGC